MTSTSHTTTAERLEGPAFITCVASDTPVYGTFRMLPGGEHPQLHNERTWIKTGLFLPKNVELVFESAAVISYDVQGAGI